jgi:hypothetical protein
MRKLLSVVAWSIIGGMVALAWAQPGQARIVWPIIPDLTPQIKVHLHRTAGVPEFRELDVRIDSFNLRSWEVHQLRELLNKVRFFELKSSVTNFPPYIPDPVAEYSITVETEGRKHTVRWNNGRQDLRALVEWLTAKATPRLQPVPLARCIVPDQATLTLTGKLQMVIRGWEEFAIWPPRKGPRPEIVVSWHVVVNGKTYQIDLGKSKELNALASKLNGQLVEMTGILVGESLQVSGLKAAQASARQSARIEITGSLRSMVLERFPPIEVWQVTVAGKTYQLSLGSEELRRQARGLIGQRVIVRGALENDRVVVRDLVALPPTRC